MPDFFALLIALLLVAAPCWLMGWYFGVKTFKNRNQKMIEALEENNKVYAEWANKPVGKEWEKGYTAGITHTLNALHAFIDRASD